MSEAQRGITVGELQAFIAKHDLPDEAHVLVDRFDSHLGEDVDSPVTSAGVRLFMNGHGELVLRVEF